ncbi:YbhB/YbcL family Raf kinase inhibitor-like protein [Pseudogulbenkiania sp. MAI-1]|uniref:YbhB/YbcL family Raf kinase inhibitor-like protein n=1 Tax=Pseudogulbenkiania sp. MAI-1 TaxID=990370 RepID=UPI00045E6489|nr:YbhB/YbcL family Raf kinase inhibitor-like protein [Pseudogulbenkiania sp. MAI-1]
MGLQLHSPAFAPGASVPARYTCDGADVSPPLAWQGEPAGTRSFALIVDDPDAPDPAAPKMTWVHWVLYNLPADSHELAEGASRHLPPHTGEGLNDWQRTGWGGPCPPIGQHRYFFKLYALDTVLPDLGHPSKQRLEQAMHSHVLGEAQLIGVYRRP